MPTKNDSNQPTPGNPGGKPGPRGYEARKGAHSGEQKKIGEDQSHPGERTPGLSPQKWGQSGWKSEKQLRSDPGRGRSENRSAGRPGLRSAQDSDRPLREAQTEENVDSR
jgi:hypothetical protein